MSQAAEAVEEEEGSPGTVLFVDDEPQILSSLRRLARRLGYQPIVANGGAEALALLEESPVDVIVSDMRMPKMTGAEFLQQAAERWPETIRILLTGYSDIESAVSAVNDGKIFRYLNKPWEDDAIKQVLDQAMEIAHLTREKLRLQALTEAQNAELAALNENLEARVQERTEQVKKAAALLATANRELKEGYVNTVQVFASLIQSGDGRGNQGTRQIAERSRAVAKILGIDEKGQEEIHLAGLLCDLGKLTLPDRLRNQPLMSMSPEDAELFREHPRITENVLLPLPPMEPIAKIVRSHCERLNGEGFPDNLSGEEIPMPARILCVVKDFDAATRGLLLAEELTAAEALKYLTDYAGSRYDGSVIKALKKVLRINEERQTLSEQRYSSAGLRSGMVVTRDLFNEHGVLILPEGMVLKAPVIEKLKRIEAEMPGELLVHAATRR